MKRKPIAKRADFHYRSPMQWYWFRVYYPKGATVNVRLSPTLAAAYAEQCRDSITLPRRLNAKYPRQPQPIAVRVVALKPPSRAHLMQIDPHFLAYLDAFARMPENDPAPLEPSGSNRSPILPAPPVL